MEQHRPQLLTVLAAALIAAFVLVPPLLASSWTGSHLVSHGDLVEASQEAFTGYWRSGGGELDARLQGLVDYWYAFHIVKGAIAGALLAVLATLAVPLWKRTGALWKSSATVVTMLALLSAAALMANVQGTLAPFSSLLPMVAETTSGESALADAGHQLSEALNTGAPTPASLTTMIDDFGWYHAVMVPIAGFATLILLVATVRLWRRFAATDRSAKPVRRLLAVTGVLSALLTLAMAAVVVANATTAANPAAALSAFFNGSW
ncbi:hypothetical protein JIG36_03185 [Actinoplanes sp. LDG1-06]|uniref:Uncharacterized protein n=1 Tax=Paractinoplanes ovalisporus TaxID=2810368 RepID=A0ABS2A3Z3_9ACTN|nr:hypothetical protein [Actinoplanes ovalisporus]MBM2614557.1 hypothetical protein [Actinoplanes ovalisporus]